MKRYRTVLEAIYRLYAHSGFAMAGAVAFSFVVSAVSRSASSSAPWPAFSAAVSSPTEAVTQLFQVLPQRVAEGIAPQVESIMGRTPHRPADRERRLSLFFATNAIETLRSRPQRRLPRHRDAALSGVLFRSMLFVFISAVSMLVLT